LRHTAISEARIIENEGWNSFAGHKMCATASVDEKHEFTEDRMIDVPRSNKMNKIKVTPYGVTHYYAQCAECRWDAGLFTDGNPEQVRVATKRHVRSTGHKVTIESVRSADYELEAQELS